MFCAMSMQNIAEYSLMQIIIYEYDHDLIILSSCTGGLHTYASFSSSTKKNTTLQASRTSDIAKSKQILDSNGLSIHLHPKTYLTYQ